MDSALLNGFRDGDVAKQLIKRIRALTDGGGPLTFMEVCGTHTVEFFRSGLRGALSGAVNLISGPGCPVCVTPNRVLDKAVAYAGMPDVVVATFGDMVRVPGSRSSLEKAKAEGGDVRIVYSTTDALELAKRHADKRVVFIGIGFETTSPTVAAAIMQAKREGVGNFAVLCAHRLIPPALEALSSSGETNEIKGFLCPGHVSTIIGSEAYSSIAEKHRIPCVVAGFEPLDMLQGILMMAEQVRSGRAEVEVQYTRAVRPEGNRKALAMLEKVFFKPADSEWRGLGTIPKSGFGIREEFTGFDAGRRWPVEIPPPEENPGCRCAEVLLGKIVPTECSLFRKPCAPESPVGACMVSSEGTCAAYYKYAMEAE
ncbi:MAG: hydrogenase formation protein HypD [bacterium]